MCSDVNILLMKLRVICIFISLFVLLSCQSTNTSETEINIEATVQARVQVVLEVRPRRQPLLNTPYRRQSSGARRNHPAGVTADVPGSKVPLALVTRRMWCYRA